MSVGDNWSRRLATGSGLLVLGRLFDIGLNAVSLIIVGRALGPDEFGLLGYATAAASLVYSLTDLGLSRAYVHSLAQSSDMRAQLSTYFILRIPVLVVGIVVAIGLALLVPDTSGLRVSIVLLASMLAAWAFRALGSIGQVTLEAQQRVIASQTVAWAYSLEYALVVAPVAVLTHDARSVALANVAPALTTFLVGLAYLRRIGFGRPRSTIAAAYIRYALPLLGAAVAGSLADYVDRFLLQAAWGAPSVGQYTAAQRVVNPISGLWSAASNFLLATVVRGRAGGHALAHIARSVHELDAVSSVVLATLVAPVIVDATATIELLLGNAFAAAGPALALLALQVWADATNYPAGMLLLGAGKSHAYAFVSATTSILLIVLLVVTVPSADVIAFGLGYGLVGAAAAVASMAVLALLMTEVLASRQYGVPFRVMPFVNLGMALLAVLGVHAAMDETTFVLLRLPVEGLTALIVLIGVAIASTKIKQVAGA